MCAFIIIAVVFTYSIKVTPSFAMIEVSLPHGCDASRGKGPPWSLFFERNQVWDYSTKDEAHLHRQSSLRPAYAYGLKLPNKEPVVIPLLHLPLLTPAPWMGGTGVHKRIVVFYNVESTIVSSNSMDSCSIID